MNQFTPGLLINGAMTPSSLSCSQVVEQVRRAFFRILVDLRVQEEPLK